VVTLKVVVSSVADLRHASDLPLDQIIDAIASACKRIFLHLSDTLSDLVLNLLFNYASTNVRPNATRGIHQLVGSMAEAAPVKTMAKLFHFCIGSIRTELDHGASSLRTISSNSPLPSDATLHWSS
jgi:proteasome activator subunit 4